jgi:hypothetical protein
VLDLRATQALPTGAAEQAMQVHVSPLVVTQNTTQSTLQACALLESQAPAKRVSIVANLQIANLNVNGAGYRIAGVEDRADIFPSVLKTAKVSFQEAPGTRSSLESEQRLGLAKFSGQVRRVVWVNEQLQIEAAGTVNRITRAIGQTEQSLMPSRLNILRAKYSEVWFAWGLLLYILGVITALLKWHGYDV